MTENEAKIFIQNAKEESKKVLAELMLIMPKVFAAKKRTWVSITVIWRTAKKKLSHARWRYGHWKMCRSIVHLERQRKYPES